MPKRVAVFQTPGGRHIVCYDGKIRVSQRTVMDTGTNEMTQEYAFYIDGLGRRQEQAFLIEWEGQPEAFAFMHPYLVAFEPSFIEICHVETVSRLKMYRWLSFREARIFTPHLYNISKGERVQVIRGVDIKSLSHHSLCRSTSPIIVGGMVDPVQHQGQLLFRLDPN
ncbi:hypothetical protein BX666DRAFT_1298228 [Dichotomocladium elegans]|nr:hypothetical protein BX666DRAFT_1298228 [Dichotomocladium elegans]